jgi:hypothetical protein
METSPLKPAANLQMHATQQKKHFHPPTHPATHTLCSTGFTNVVSFSARSPLVRCWRRIIWRICSSLKRMSRDNSLRSRHLRRRDSLMGHGHTTIAAAAAEGAIKTESKDKVWKGSQQGMWHTALAG